MESNEQPTPSFQPSDPFDKEPATEPEPATSMATEPETPPVIITPDPTPTTATTTAPQPAPVVTPVSPGHIILQWLTYAFWGWALLALSWLAFLVFFYFLQKTPGLDTILPYALAANLVLLPISLVCDIFYHRHEHPKKTGISMAVMIIHAVLFALFGIGALIGTVFSLVQLLVSDGSTTTSLATLLSFGVVTIMYAATFVRTLNPRASKLLPRAYIILMSVVVLVFVILALVGPFAQARLTKNDRLIETNLATVQTGVDTYVTSNKKLPSSLNDLTLTSDAKQLVTSNLVEYKNEGEVLDPTTLNSTTKLYDLGSGTDRIFHYQLCVTYQAASATSIYASGVSSESTSDYTSYIYTYNHPAGPVCYKVEKDLYNYNYLQPVLNGATN